MQRDRALSAVPRRGAQGTGRVPGMVRARVFGTEQQPPTVSAVLPRRRSPYMTGPATPVIEVIIPGDPIGAPRMTQRDKWLRRPVVVRYNEWREAARLAMIAAGVKGPPEEIEVNAWLSMPKTWSAKEREEQAGKLATQRKPDVDNILKAVLDCFADDKGVARALVIKRWIIGEPRVVLRLIYR